MATTFHTAVKIAAAVYILYKIWLLLFRDRLFGLWDRIFLRKASRPKAQEASPPVVNRPVSLVGPARGGYLEPPVVMAPVPPVPAKYTAVNDEVFDVDFETGSDVEQPSNPELYGAGNEYPQVADYSTGRSFDQLMEAFSYVAAPVEDEEMMMRTAETLSIIRDSDLFEMMERQAGYTDIIGRLMAECLDENGNRLPKRKPLIPEDRPAFFDVDKYI